MIATYRLQLHPDFDFADVRGLLPYFQELGVSHLYLSPITQARSGSTHGYDVVNHNAISEELGGRDEFFRLADACAESGLKLILDFVPNHAGVGPRNRYWQDVLAHGPHAEFAYFFDIEWTSLKSELRDRILLPFLGRTYGEVLDDGELRIVFEEGYFFAAYFENRFALAPTTYPLILDLILDNFEREDLYFDIKNLVDAYQTLGADELEKAESLRVRLISLLEGRSIDAQLQAIAQRDLHEILERQFWRLSFWKTAGSEINYRRFFDINELVALRMEDERVFWDGHRLLGELTAHPAVDGVRIDHVDGLADPHQYLERLKDVGPKHVWVEKILALREILPPEWPVDGTTGYEFMNDVMGLLIDESSEADLDRVYQRFTGDGRSYGEIARQSKHLVMETTLSSERLRLAYELDRISEADYHTRDFTLEVLQRALQEVVASLDRYRTYLPYDADGAQEVITEAIHRARMHAPGLEPSVFDFIRSVIMGDVREDLLPAQKAWTRRLQQYCAPVAAKGVEDTSFYRYHRLSALNEVGGEPDEFGRSIAAFHSRSRFRARSYPLTMLATATHDHKRGEDTRMRLIALSEIADRWAGVVKSLDDIAGDHVTDAGPSRPDVYVFYQMVAALWMDAQGDDLADRISDYLLKAAREAKENTSWTHANEAYEEALDSFIRGMLSDARFAVTIDDVARRMADIGIHNSIVQLILKFTTPGVPDVYQGTELWDLSMVDPDNRRAVDYERRKRLVERYSNVDMSHDEILERIANRDIDVKLYVMTRLMQLRRSFPMTEADYRELAVDDDGADRWIAYLREHDGEAVLVACRRHINRESDGPAAISLPDDFADRKWTDVLSSETRVIGDNLHLDQARPFVVLMSSGM